MTGFGACCDDLREALDFEEGKTMNLDDGGVLYLTVAAVDTDSGPGFFDIAVRFCPFCGTELQTQAAIAAASGVMN